MRKSLKLNDSGILSSLSTTNVATNKIVYHKRCLKTFNNRYSAAANSELKQEVAQLILTFII